MNTDVDVIAGRDVASSGTLGGAEHTNKKFNGQHITSVKFYLLLCC